MRGGGPVHANRKTQPVFMDKGGQGHWRHRLVVLEHRMQANDDNALLREPLMHRLCLWHAVADTAGTEHLERMQNDDAATQGIQRQRLWGVEPLTDI